MTEFGKRYITQLMTKIVRFLSGYMAYRYGEKPSFSPQQDGSGVVAITEPSGVTLQYQIAPELTHQAIAEAQRLKNSSAATRERYRRDFDTHAQRVVDSCDPLQKKYGFATRAPDDLLQRTAVLTVAVASDVEPSRVVRVLDTIDGLGRTTADGNLIVRRLPDGNSETARVA